MTQDERQTIRKQGIAAREWMLALRNNRSMDAVEDLLDMLRLDAYETPSAAKDEWEKAHTYDGTTRWEAKDARELVWQIDAICNAPRDHWYDSRVAEAAAEIERFVAARLVAQEDRHCQEIDQAVAYALAERAPSPRFREWVESIAKDDYPEGTRTASFTRILDQLNGDKAEERAPSPSACRWHESEYSWDSECGLSWVLEADDPEANEMHYCPKCGRKLVAESPMSTEETK